MRFASHSAFEGMHAFLSASKYHWVNYDDDKLLEMYATHSAATRGTELHRLAADLIRLVVPLPRNEKTINRYVNDAIGFRMAPEVVLLYSRNAFGTVDAISYRKNKLRIHDLKTGTTRTSMKQLEVYCALFCLEYRIRPSEISIELRIYQNDEVLIHVPALDDIVHIMDKIVTFDKMIEQAREEDLG